MNISLSLSQVLHSGIEINLAGNRRTLVFNSDEREIDQTPDNIMVSVTSECSTTSNVLYNAFGQSRFIMAIFHNISKKQIQLFLIKPLQVRLQSKIATFKYFGQSPSQLRKKVCVLYDQALGNRQDLLGAFGNFDKIKDTAKYSARVGLLLSSFNKVMELREHNLDYSLEDVERNGFNFTDGCGIISPDLLVDIADQMHISFIYRNQKFKCPSVIQIRLNGCKGVLSAAKNNSIPRKIWLRKSLVKFEWVRIEPYTLGVCDDGVSRPYCYGYLNKQFISILSANGVPDRVLLDKQRNYFNDMDLLLVRMEVALRYLYFWNRFDLAENLLVSKDLHDNRSSLVKSFLKEKRKKFISSQFREETGREKKSEAEGLKIPVEKSRNVFGIADHTNVLMSGECFFQPTSLKCLFLF